MTVTPKQLREAADTLDAAHKATDRATDWPYVARQLREMAYELDVPVGAIRQLSGEFATYIKDGENSWIGVFPLGRDNVTLFDLTDDMVNHAPIVHKPS